MCAALPACKPLFIRLLPLVFDPASKISKDDSLGNSIPQHNRRDDKDEDIELQETYTIALTPRVGIPGGSVTNKQLPQVNLKHRRQPMGGKYEAEVDRISGESYDLKIEGTQEAMQTSEFLTPQHSHTIGQKLERDESLDTFIDRNTF